MFKRLLHLCLFLGAVFTLGAPIEMIVSGLNSLSSAHARGSVESIVPVKLRSKTGTFVFSRRRNFDKKSTSIHLQGQLSIRGKKYPASATKIGDKLIITHPSRIRNRHQRLNTITLKVTDSEILSGRIKSVPNSIFERTACESKHEERVLSRAVMPINEGVADNTYLFVTLHTYADAQFNAKYGDLTNDQILSYVNSAEAIYSTQLGIRFKITGQTILSNADSITNPGDILSSFRTNPLTQDEASLRHLFTGKDMDGVTVGIAYIGAVCSVPKYSYGVSQDYYGFTSQIFAHEVGHNFGASHTTEQNTIMYPSISIGATRFSADSVNLMNLYLNEFGSCLNLEPYAPDLTKAILSINRHGKKIRGKLLDKGGSPLNNRTIVVYVNARSYRVTTSAVGAYSYLIKQKKRERKYIVYASTENNETTSRRLKFAL